MAHYNLIFQGKIIAGASLDEVKTNVARLFKADAKKTAALFSGQSIVIKKNLDTESAKKYLAVLKQAGAVVKAVKVENLPADSNNPDNSNSRDNSSEHNSNAESSQQQTDNTATASNGLSPGLASLVNYNTRAALPETSTTYSKPTETAATERLQLAPADSEILTHKKHSESVNLPDISHLSMSDAQTGSLDEFSPPVEALELPDIENLTMSEANTGSLEKFAVNVEPLELPDFSNLTVAEQNDTPLSANSPAADPVNLPDTSELSMSAAQEGTLEGVEIKTEPLELPDISHINILETPEENKTVSGKAVFQID